MKPVALIAVVLALAISGCGGSDSTSTEETWAAGVCSSIATWRTQVETISTDAAQAITKPGATRKDIENAIDDGVAASTTLVDDLRALTPPATPEGAQAKVQVDAFIDDVRASIDELERTIAALPDGASLAQVIAKLSGLASTLQTTLESGRNLITSLPQLGSDLKDGFENAASCKELRGTS